MGCSNVLNAEAQFVGEGREYIVAKFQFVFWPDKARVGVSSPGGFIYWKKILSTMSYFVLNQHEKTFEIVEVGSMWDFFFTSRER